MNSFAKVKNIFLFHAKLMMSVNCIPNIIIKSSYARINALGA